MISAEDFIDLLEEKDLLPADLVAGLRRRISDSQVPSAEPPWNKPITAARLAKWLVDNGHLSRLLAQRLLARAQGPADKPTAPPSPPPAPERRPAPEEDELGLAPLEGEEVARPSVPKKPKPSAKPETPAAPATPRRPSQPPAEGPKPPAAEPLASSLFDEELPSAVPDAAAGGEPLDALLDGTLLEADAAASPLDATAREKRGLLGLFGRATGFRKARKKENVWDSSLLLVGGGTLLGMVILGGVLIWAFSRQSGDEMLDAANQFYQQGSYTNAIRNYNRYLEEFPKHSGVSLARVRRGLAQLRQATDATSNWSGALETAKRVLEEIASEEEFATEARPELTALLPKIAEGLAGKAHQQLDSSLVGKANEALALVNKYVPNSQRPVTRLEDVQALLALTEREIAQGAELDRATAAMLKAVDQGDMADAYQIRNALLRQYPRLADNQQLREAVLAVSQAEQSAVKMVSEQRAPETSEPPAVAESTVTLAQRRAEKTVPGADGRVVCAVAEGAAYGLDAATGKVLWRRRVGFGARAASPVFPPTPVAEKPGSDVVLVDAERHEVLRVAAATGELRWRFPLGEPFDAHPVVADDRLLVATPSGRIVEIDLTSGSSPGYVQLRQALRVAPAVDLRRSGIYQVAEHSNLFVLSLPDGKAMQTVYLGHAPGSITAPPVVVSHFLVLAENDRAEGGTLRVLSLEAAGEEEPPVRLLQEVRLDGYVDTPPLVSGVRLLVITDRGDVRVFEISGSKTDAPLVEVARGKAAGKPYLPDGARAAEIIRFPLMLGGQVWIADNQLTRYELRASLGRLEPKGIENEASVTVQPPVAIGRAVVHVRRKIGQPGVLVSAMPMDGGRALWETRLAAPLIAEPAIDAEGRTITAITSLGGVFQLGFDQVEGVVLVDQPTAALKPADVRRPLTDLVPLADGLLAMATTGGPKQVAVLDPRRPERLRFVFLPDALGCRPLAFAGGLIAPLKLGQVVLLDPRTGQERVEPFQPRLESGVDVDWRGGTAVDDTAFVLADGHNRLYRIGIKENPKPHLAKLVEVDLSESIASPLAELGGMVYAVDAADTLLAFELPELTRGPMWPLGARRVWGPYRVGDRVMVATDDDRLCCVDAAQNMVWKIALPYGPLAGAPLATKDGYVLAAAGGVVWRIEASTGEEIAKVQTGTPLATGLVPLESRLLVGGHDGSLYEIERP